MLYLYTWPLEPFQDRRFHPYVFRSKRLLHLALPLEAECLVDPEFPGDREEGHTDGDAANVSDHLR
jgi:hypothetical protein